MKKEISHNSNIYCTYMCEHAQKITEALYRITDIFPDREPLKWYLRKEGLLIFKMFLKIDDASIYERVKYVDKVERTIPHMIHALELSSLGTFISRTNFEVLSREYNKLLDFVKDKRNELLPESVKQLSVRSFEDRLKDNDENNSNEHEKEKSATPEKSANVFRASVMDKIHNEQKEDLAAVVGGNENVQINSSFSGVPFFVDKNMDSFQKADREEIKKNIDRQSFSSGRRDKILSIIHDKGEVSVSDVSSYFGGVSDKTIQRDLLSLVEEGIVRKFGDKRWRRYVLQ